MKRFFIIFAFLTAALVGCQREAVDEDTPVKPTAVLRTVKVDLQAGSEDSDTKSYVAGSVESFRRAYLFAFIANEGPDKGKAYTYESGGDIFPVAKYTSSKSFDWDLPVGEAGGVPQRVDIWAIVNPSSDTVPWLEDMMEHSTLTESDLEALVYECENLSSFSDMEDDGMPMSGKMNNLYLESTETPVVFTLKRLYAKYLISLDPQLWEADGYSIECAWIEGSRTNTRLPYFSEDYTVPNTAAGRSQMKLLDRGDEDDIDHLMEFSPSYTATLYSLENCQGSRSGASHWYDVGTSVADKEVLSSITIGIIATKSGRERKFSYELFLGSDCRTNFDVVRNTRKHINVTLPEVPTNYFTFTSTPPVAIERGSSEFIWFETSFSGLGGLSEFSTSNPGLTITDLHYTYNVVTKKSTGYVEVTAGAYMSSGSYNVTFSKNDSNGHPVGDKCAVHVPSAGCFFDFNDSDTSGSSSWEPGENHRVHFTYDLDGSTPSVYAYVDPGDEWWFTGSSVVTYSVTFDSDHSGYIDFDCKDWVGGRDFGFHVYGGNSAANDSFDVRIEASDNTYDVWVWWEVRALNTNISAYSSWNALERPVHTFMIMDGKYNSDSPSHIIQQNFEFSIELDLIHYSLPFDASWVNRMDDFHIHACNIPDLSNPGAGLGGTYTYTFENLDDAFQDGSIPRSNRIMHCSVNNGIGHVVLNWDVYSVYETWWPSHPAHWDWEYRVMLAGPYNNGLIASGAHIEISTKGSVCPASCITVHEVYTDTYLYSGQTSFVIEGHDR